MALSLSRACFRTRLHRTFATNFPRPPPPPTEPPHVEMFSDTSRPRPFRELPRIKRRWPAILALSVVGVAAWGVFYSYATNQQKISSSVFKQVLRTAREDQGLRGALGEALRPQPEWWLNGEPRVLGAINILQGHVDLSFRIRGSKGVISLSPSLFDSPPYCFLGSGTVYFTSVRREKGIPYEILRFKVIADDGTVLNVDSSKA
ncbi:cytochrome oxidase complex assembly protein 1-domain-containing protein [Armillaria novae-zelandiae]|uniref:Cytochrome oxidase complex assembly protein 1-domain-containing protein n=1 Tax=Armillaria novae-zelandiae TaxID=153914 RepID=A0AA39PM49_9AGAR|nr:cytochrome oxidase complex assembly protein 1-domain-containing protein [Armillaria novae-zelandiae]